MTRGTHRVFTLPGTVYVSHRTSGTLRTTVFIVQTGSHTVCVFVFITVWTHSRYMVRHTVRSVVSVTGLHVVRQTDLYRVSVTGRQMVSHLSTQRVSVTVLHA